jgi:GNAT superfamily N-acetyltransferase
MSYNQTSIYLLDDLTTSKNLIDVATEWDEVFGLDLNTFLYIERKEETKVYYAKTKGKYSGYIVIMIRRMEIVVCLLFVKDVFRRRGVGNMLMWVAEEEARKRRLPITLFATMDNVSTSSFYLKRGFNPSTNSDKIKKDYDRIKRRLHKMSNDQWQTWRNRVEGRNIYYLIKHV